MNERDDEVEHAGQRDRRSMTQRWRGLSTWTQYLFGWGVFCAAFLGWTAIPAASGVIGAALRAVLLVGAPPILYAVGRYVFAHRWDRPQVAQAVWVGATAGVLICVPTGSVVQAVIAGPLLGAVAWFIACLGLRDRARLLPPPPLPPPPRPGITRT